VQPGPAGASTVCVSHDRPARPPGRWRLALLCAATLVLWAIGAATAVAAAAPPPPSYNFADLDLPRGEAPLPVLIDFQLLHLHAIDDEAEAFEFSGMLTLGWHDPGQAFDPATTGAPEKVFSGDFQFNEVAPGWFPQVVLVNALQAPESQGVLVRVRPDGTSTVQQLLHARARSQFQLRRYPFDSQRLQLEFEILGFGAQEVQLLPAAATAPPLRSRIEPPEWRLRAVRLAPGEPAATGATPGRVVLAIDIERRSFFMLRLVLLPLGLIVALSWVVFWMDRSSLGDRMSVSFVGILTAVAYQSMISAIMPHIAYVTFMNAYVVMCLFLMSATALVNLVVGNLDQRGETRRGDRIDWHCRWVFPLTFAVLIAGAWVVNFVFA